MISITPVQSYLSQSCLLPTSFSRLCIGLVVSLVSSVISLTVTTPPSAIANAVPKPAEETLPAAQSETIMLGRSPQQHYVVIIPVSTLMKMPKKTIETTPPFVLLQKIRTIAPQAFLARHSLGQYIYVGGFEQFGLAQRQLRQIQPSIPNARIVYFP